MPAHEQGGDTAAVQLSVTQAPLDARCVRVTIDSATGPQSATRFVDTVPGGSTTVVLGGLPTGLLRLFGEGFDATCAMVGTGTSLPSTWVSDVVEATLAAGSTVDVPLSMRRPGSATSRSTSTPHRRLSLSSPLASLPPAISRPNDVAIDPLGQTWVLDAGSSRVVRVGGPLAPVPSPPPLGEMLALPNGTLLVSAPVDGRTWSVSGGRAPAPLHTSCRGAARSDDPRWRGAGLDGRPERAPSVSTHSAVNL